MQQEIKVPGYLKLSKVLGYIMYAWVFFGIIVLGLRVFLLAFSANATTPFVEFIYRTSADYLEPFRGIFPSKSISETGYLDVAAIFAMIIYLLIGWGFSAFINYIQSKIDQFQATETEQLNTATSDSIVTATTRKNSKKPAA